MAILSARAAPAAIGLGALLIAACEGPANEVLVLHTADAYGYFDTCGCRADSTGGLAKRAWVVDSLRRNEKIPILLVDAGDFTGGENVYGAALGRVMVDAMELMGYDAFTLGEWDLNQGPAYIRSIVENHSIAWVHTNYDVKGLEGKGHRALIIERGGRRIGLLGLMNPTILLDPSVRDSVVVDEDIVGVAQRAVTALREEGVDAVVVLSHLSYKGDRALADYVQGIDLIVSGHGGKTLPAPEAVVPGTWIVAAGDLGRFLGRASVRFGGGGEGQRAVRDVSGDLIVMVPQLPNDPRLDPLFAAYEEERQSLLRREIDALRASRYFMPVPPRESAPGPIESPGS